MTIWSQFVETVMGKQEVVDPHKSEVDKLMAELEAFEIQGWISSLIDSIAYGELNPQAVVDTWNTLGNFSKQLAFMYLLGACKALMEPPSEDHSVVTV